MEKNRITVVINSRQYTLISNEDEEYMQALAEHINEKVNYVRKNTSNIIGERPVILAALNICDEYFKAIQAGLTLQEQMEKHNLKMEELIEENKQLQTLKKDSEYEIDINTMQKQLVDYSQEVQKLEMKLRTAEKQKKEAQSESEKLKQEQQEQTDALEKQYREKLTACEQKYQAELEKLKAEYAAKEQEMLNMIDKL